MALCSGCQICAEVSIITTNEKIHVRIFFVSISNFSAYYYYKTQAILIPNVGEQLNGSVISYCIVVVIAVIKWNRNSEPKVVYKGEILFSSRYLG